MVRPFSVLALFMFGLSLSAQNTILDSLRHIYTIQFDPTKKADTYYDWAYALLNENPETGLLSADTLIGLAKKANSTKNRSRAEYLRGYAYTLLGNTIRLCLFTKKNWNWR